MDKMNLYRLMRVRSLQKIKRNKNTLRNRIMRHLPHLFTWIAVITTPIFIVDIIVMTIWYVDNPTYSYIRATFIGLAIGVAASFARYWYIDNNRKIYEIWGIPIPYIIFEDGADFPVFWGIILNPLYYILLTNTYYINAHLINGIVYVVLFWIIILTYVTFQISKIKSDKTKRNSS